MVRVKVTYRHGDAGSFTVTDGEANYEGVLQQYLYGLMAAIAAVPKELKAVHAFWEIETPRGPVVKEPSDEWWREACRGGHVTAANPDYLCDLAETNDTV